MDIFTFNKSFLSHLNLQEKQMYVNGLHQSLFPIDYSPLFSMILNHDKNSISHYLLYGHDLNQYNLKGLCLIHLIILLICHNSEYLKYLEFFLKMGASPNTKTFFFIKTKLLIMNSLQLLEYILSTKDLSDFPFHLKYTPLSKESLFSIYLLLYIYECDIYSISEWNQCHSMTVDQIKYFFNQYLQLLSSQSSSQLLSSQSSSQSSPQLISQLYPQSSSQSSPQSTSESLLQSTLQLYIHYYWKIYWNQNSVIERHLYLTQHYQHIQYPIKHCLLDGIYINQTFEEKDILQQVCQYEFLGILLENKIYYFHCEILPHLLKSQRHPLTQEFLDIDCLLQCFHYLERIGCLRFNPERHIHFPFLFSQTLSQPFDLYVEKIKYIYEFIKIINPYSNILLLKKFTMYETEYFYLQLHYHYPSLFPFESNQYPFSLVDQIIYCFQSDYNSIYFVSHYFDEIYNDIQLYKKINDIFIQKKLSFICDFYEAILLLEIFEIMMEQFGSFQMYEFMIVWEKILLLYTLQYPNIDQESVSFPLLLNS